MAEYRTVADNAEFDESLIRRYDRPGPRYTSYPTALQFSPTFGPDEFVAAARASNAASPPKPLSIYVHVPFCASPCFYCGCNKVITRDARKGERYLETLGREIEIVGAAFSRRRPVDQLHLGGGTPTFLSTDQIAGLLGTLDRGFSLSRHDAREFSIEIDPRTVDAAGVARLAALGFNRVSLGIQDFDPRVQVAVNRVQSAEHTLGLIDAARAAGIRSVSVDLIYGLPLQTADSFARTLELVANARPDRLAVYSYAHLPHLFKPQKQIRSHDLPSAPDKLALLGLTVERLTAAGYVYVGMDHFARPDDELVKAQQDGSLQRNFQGYSTQADCDLVGLGVSSISKVGATYSQNAKTLSGYYAAIDAGRLATDRGIRLAAEDELRRDVIQALMCASRVDFATIDARYGIEFEQHFAAELKALGPLLADRLVDWGERSLQVTRRGRLLMRNVAMVFDPYLKQVSPESASPRYSRAV
jgi:oxygen-independent coproporphyrinogen III oxidase